MKKIAGRWVVGVAFSSASMAAKFEEAISDRFLPGVEEALIVGEGQFFELSEPETESVRNVNTGDVTGSLVQCKDVHGGIVMGGNV